MLSCLVTYGCVCNCLFFFVGEEQLEVGWWVCLHMDSWQTDKQTNNSRKCKQLVHCSFIFVLCA